MLQLINFCILWFHIFHDHYLDPKKGPNRPKSAQFVLLLRELRALTQCVLANLS